MAKIDLGFDKGVQVTGSAGHGGTNINLGGAINAAGQVGNAFENVSRGIKHVSDSLFGVFNDLADTRNRQEFLEGQTAMFDLSNAENERFEERMRRGEFDGAGGLEMFKQEALKSQEKVKEAFSNWVSKNVTQSNTRKILNEQMALDGKKNFAHLSGRFLAYDNERRFNLMKSQCDRAVEDGSMVNLNAAIKAYVGGGKDKDGNDLPRRKSQEFEDNLRKEYERKFNVQRLFDAKNYISSEISSDKIEEYLHSFKQTDSYASLPDGTKKVFDVFASNRIDTIKRGKASAVKNAQKSLVEDFQKGIKADISDAYNTCAKFGLDFANVKIGESRERLVNILDGNEVLPGEKKKILLDFDRFCEDEREKSIQRVESAMYKQAEDVLKEAVEANDYTLDTDKLSGGDEKFADKIKEARRERENLVNRNESIARRIQGGSLSEQEVIEAQNYRRNYFSILSGVFDYDKDLDPRGEKLANLIVETQKFDRKSRKELTDLLYNKVVKQKMPANWSAADVKNFDKEYSDFSKWDDDEVWGLGDDSDPAGYAVLRDRIMNLAIARNLNYSQAMEEVKKDPFYIKIKTKKARKDAIETLKLNLW